MDRRKHTCAAQPARARPPAAALPLEVSGTVANVAQSDAPWVPGGARRDLAPLRLAACVACARRVSVSALYARQARDVRDADPVPSTANCTSASLPPCWEAGALR